MKVRVQTQIGSATYIFEVEERDEKEALHKSIVFGEPPRFCQECKNTKNFRLDSNKDKEGNTYINTVCINCGAKAKLGSYKAGGYFWHKFEKYVPNGKKEPKNAGSDVDWSN